MNVDLLLTLGVIVGVLVALMFEVLSTDVIFVAGLAVVTVFGVIDLETALQGFGNSTLLALGSLYVVAAALRETGALDAASRLILGQGGSTRSLLLRMCPPVTAYSAFLNNTPVVAMGIPAVRSWCQRHNVSPSLLLMPLSYAAILGGICTLIGTSTNLVVHGLLQSHGMQGFGFFELAYLGVPCAVVGLAYVIFVMPSFLEERIDIEEEIDEIEREQAELVEIELVSDSPLAGQTVGNADLDFLPNLALVQIDRGEQRLFPVSADTTLKAGDRLLFAPMDPATDGVEAGDIDLAPYPGLRLAMTGIERKEGRELHRVVVREGSSLAGKTIRALRFPERFGATVTDVRRGGNRPKKPLNEFRLRPGDILLLESGTGFRETHEEDTSFFVVTEAGGEEKQKSKEESQDVVPEKRIGGWQLGFSVAVVVGVVAAVASGLTHVAVSGMIGAVAVIGAGIINPGKARRAIDWEVLIVIGAALGLGKAMEASGAAQLIGENIVTLMEGFGPRGVLAGVVIATALLTELITNNGAVALTFPVALATAETMGVDPRGMIVALTLAGSMSLLTPIGYQTNLMVYGPGGYHFSDYFKAGGFLAPVLWIVVIALAPVVWSF